ncbi:hypothetical protein FKM82_028812, partial [Ascaphus truei]
GRCPTVSPWAPSRGRCHTVSRADGRRFSGGSVGPGEIRGQADTPHSDNVGEPAHVMERKGSIVSRANSIGSTSASSVPNT